jgi:hypothetical protein
MGEKINIEDYTKNSIIVYGPGTLKIKDELRKLGSWRPLKQRTDPKKAWIIPKSKEEQVVKLIESKGKIKPKKSAAKERTQKSEKPPIPIITYIDCVEQTAKVLGMNKDEVYKIVDRVYYPEKGKSPKLRTKAFNLPPKLYIYNKKDDELRISSREKRMVSLKWKKAKYTVRDIPGFSAADHDEMRVDSKTQTLIIPEGVVKFKSDDDLVYEGKPIKKIICPSTLEILTVIDNYSLESIKFSKKRNNLSWIDCSGCKNLKSLDLTPTKVIIIRVPFCRSLKELILPQAGPKNINIMRTALLALIVPPGVEHINCGTDVKLEKIYLKKNKQNAGDPRKPSKQEKILAECIVGGAEKTKKYKRSGLRLIPTGKFNFHINFQDKFVWYETFPTPAEQRAIFSKINPPDVSIFENLSPDIIAEILMNLPINQLANFCRTSVKISRICRDHLFQRSYLSRKYGVKFNEDPEYYGFKSYLKLYEAFDRGINWKNIKIDNKIKGKYIGPPGVKYDKETQTLTMPKGTIGIKPDGAEMKTGSNVVEKIEFEKPEDVMLIDPSDIQYVSVLKDLMVLDPIRITEDIIEMPLKEGAELRKLGIPYTTVNVGWGSGPPTMIVRFNVNQVWPKY